MSSSRVASTPTCDSPPMRSCITRSPIVAVAERDEVVMNRKAEKRDVLRESDIGECEGEGVEGDGEGAAWVWTRFRVFQKYAHAIPLDTLSVVVRCLFCQA